MYKYSIMLLLVLLALGSSSFAQKIETKGEDVYVDGEKRFRVVQTKKLNYLTSEMPHFSVYDVEGQEKIKFQNFKLLFPGSKSFIATDYLINSSGKALIKFLAQDSLFTAKGYNKAYERAFITKYKGYFDDPAGGKLDADGKPARDKSKAVSIQGDVIMQDGQIVGHMQTNSREKVCTSKYAGTDKKILAIATYACDLAKPANIEVTLEMEGKKDVKLSIYYLAKVESEVANYLVKQGVL